MGKMQMPPWSRALFREDMRHIAVYGGRGSSKSHSVARALLVRAAQKRLRVVCAREFQESISRSVKKVLDDVIASDDDLREFYRSTDTEIRGQNGSLFWFVGLARNIDSVKSLEGADICWVEEAQSISQRSIDVLVPTIRKPGSQILWVWNPTKEDDPVDVMFRKGERLPDELVVPVNFSDNPWFPDELKREMHRDAQRDQDRYRHIWLGDYVTRSVAAVFHDFRAVTTPPDLPFGAVPRFGADWGYSPDPTVLVKCWVNNGTRTIYVEKELYRTSVEIEDIPAFFDEMEEAVRFPIVADSARPDVISHVRNHGYPKIVEAKKGPNSVEDGVEFLKGYTILVGEGCVHTLKELSLYSRKVDPKTGKVLSALEDKNNHVIDALRYALEGDRRGIASRPPPPKVVAMPIVTRWQ